MSGALHGVVTAISISRATMTNIRQNLFFALIYIGVGVPVAAGVLYPALGWQLSPMIAAVAMSASSLSVVGNANRLRRYQPPVPVPPATTSTIDPGAGDSGVPPIPRSAMAAASTPRDQPATMASAAATVQR
jgi:Cu+-exporting ATPase